MSMRLPVSGGVSGAEFSPHCQVAVTVTPRGPAVRGGRPDPDPHRPGHTLCLPPVGAINHISHAKKDETFKSASQNSSVNILE